jgi:hypothetical protein|uniref:Uncharacterized protein n=1 Tax=Zea mays TaxID=4577 RepID=A0A804MA17_MAIZE
MARRSLRIGRTTSWISGCPTRWCIRDPGTRFIPLASLLLALLATISIILRRRGENRGCRGGTSASRHPRLQCGPQGLPSVAGRALVASPPGIVAGDFTNWSPDLSYHDRAAAQRGRTSSELNLRYGYHFPTRRLSLSVSHKVALGLGLLGTLPVWPAMATAAPGVCAAARGRAGSELAGAVDFLVHG